MITNIGISDLDIRGAYGSKIEFKNSKLKKVLEHYKVGRSSQEIADILDMNVKTIYNYKSILKKRKLLV